MADRDAPRAMTGGPACPNVLTKIGSACRQRSGDVVGLERAPRKAPTEATAHHWSPEPRATVDDENVTILAASANMRPAGDGAEQRMLWMGNIQAHWTNAFVRSLFLVGGPEGVGGVEVSIRRNAFRVSPDTPSVGFALVTFATREAASEALARLQDTPVPGAEGHARFLLRKHAATLTTTTETPGTVRDGVSLRSQLAPLNVGELRRRLELLGAPSSPEREREVRASGGNGALRLWLLRRLCAAHGEVSEPPEPRASRFALRARAVADPATTTRALPPMPSPSASARCAPRSGRASRTEPPSTRTGTSRSRRSRAPTRGGGGGTPSTDASGTPRARCWRASPGRTRRRWSTASR